MIIICAFRKIQNVSFPTLFRAFHLLSPDERLIELIETKIRTINVVKMLIEIEILCCCV